MILNNFPQTSRGPFSAVSTPIFAKKYSLEKQMLTKSLPELVLVAITGLIESTVTLKFITKYVHIINEHIAKLRQKTIGLIIHALIAAQELALRSPLVCTCKRVEFKNRETTVRKLRANLNDVQKGRLGCLIKT